MSWRSAHRAASTVETARSGALSTSTREGSEASGGVERSLLLPTRRRVRFGEARARASVRKVGREAKEGCEVMS